MLLGVAKDAYLNYCSKTTHYRTIFLTVLWSFYRVILLKFFQQSLWAALHFRSRKYRSRHFTNEEIRIPWRSMRPSMLFGCRTPEKSTRKAGFEVCGWSLHPVLDWERNTPSKESLPVHECNIGFL